MRWLWMLLALISAIGPSAVFSQGGKAEPKRIELAKGRSSITVSGILSNGQEMDYIFGAVSGQKVSLKVTSTPKGNLFDFSLQGDGFDIDTDHDSYTEYAFTAPETGDYLVNLRKRPTETAAKAKFFLVLTIR